MRDVNNVVIAVLVVIVCVFGYFVSLDFFHLHTSFMAVDHIDQVSTVLDGIFELERDGEDVDIYILDTNIIIPISSYFVYN